MLRKTPLTIFLALGLGAAPAFAQPAPAAAPEDSTAARTLEQNRRVSVGWAAPSEPRSTAASPGAAPSNRNAAAGEKPAARRHSGAGRVAGLQFDQRSDGR